MFHTSIHTLFAERNEYRKDVDKWRLTPRITGEFNGLPLTRGTLLATNGILALVDCGRPWLFEGHLDFFVADERERMKVVRELTSTPKATDHKETRAINNLVNELML